MNCGAAVIKDAPAKTTDSQETVCAVCGNPIQEGHAFCMNCGAAVTKDAPRKQPIAQKLFAQSAATPSKKAMLFA